MVECEFCEEEFENEVKMHVHWLEEHEDEMNSHQKDEAKKSQREYEERQKQVKERRKKYLYQGTAAVVLLGLAALIGPQLVDAVLPGGAVSFDVQNEPMIGDESAEVTVVEFGDFQCPACQRFDQQVYPKLKSNYIDTGDVRFVWMDYPLSQIHNWARPAAETMECVYRQDEEAFWNVKSTVYNQQSTLTASDIPDSIIGFAESEGVNGSKVRACVQSGDAENEVSGDRRKAMSSGATGTPSIYVNGKKVGSSYAAISSAIDEELSSE